MITKELFGKTINGEEIYKFTLTNKTGANISVITYGGTLTSINVPDRDGKLGDVICGYDNISDYEKGDQNQGALVGRFANRIKAGKFTLNGKKYILAKNDNGINHLHGGNVGYIKRVWEASTEECENCDKLHLCIFSPDGEEGYPGNLKLNVTYTFDDLNRLTIDYSATSDADTICNFTNHAYFNLAGYASCDVKEHEIKISADYITETDDELIPTGNLLTVDNTIYDFRQSKPIGSYEYDDNFVINADGMDSIDTKLVCTVAERTTGRMLNVYTTLPGMQLYTGNFMEGGIPFKNNVPSKYHHAFCLETQRWPDSPNHKNFSDCTLKAGQEFKSQTIYEFYTEKI